jgi:two-component system, NarL family, sensor histidine kinase EvgS
MGIRRPTVVNQQANKQVVVGLNPMRWMARLFLMGISLACWAASASAQGQEARFRASASVGQLDVSRDWLTTEERNFLAGLSELRVAVPRSGGSPPYEEISANNEVGGIQADILVSLARTIGFKVKPVLFDTWPETLQAARRGDVDMVLTLAVTTDRREYLAFTLGTVPVPNGMFGRSAQVGPPPEGARFALEQDFASNDTVRRRFPAARIITHQDTLSALKAVAAGEADYYLGSLLEVVHYMGRNPVPGVELREMIRSGSGHYHIGVRKALAPLVPMLNRGITGLRGTPPRSLADAVVTIGSNAANSPNWPNNLSLDEADQRELQRRPVWRVGAVRGLPLLNDIDAQGDHSGIASDYVEQAATRLGVGTEVVAFDSVGDMLDGLRGGRIDLVPLLTPTPQREKEFLFSRPYFEMPYVLLGRSDGPLYWDLGSLRGRRLALGLQHPLRPLLAERYPEVQLVDAPNGNVAMDMVVSGQADAAVEVKSFANLRIHADTAARLRVLGQVDQLPARFAFAARQDEPALMALVDRVIESIDERERERMQRRWVAVDLNPPFPWRRWLPTLSTAAAGLLLLLGASVWWARRLAAESRERARAVERLEDIARTVPAVTFRYVIHADGRQLDTYYSPGAEAFFGVPLPAGRMLLDTLRPHSREEDHARLKQAEQRSMASGKPFRGTVHYAHPDGRQLRLLTEAVRGRTASGQTTWTGFVTDVSSEHALQQQLAQEAEQRYVMLASASHELRAPTHTLSLALQSLPAGSLQGQANDRLRVAKDAAQTLAQLLDDVLDAARVTVGRVELRPQVFDLHGWLRQLANAQSTAAAQKGLVFTLRQADELPRSVQADPLRLKQVLTNLLSNAIKYTERGSVDVYAACATLPGNMPALSFVVQDTGVGISAEQQQRLFEPFAAADPGAGARSTGLGLSVSRRLVDLMGGRIDIASTAGRGTRATVLVPWVQPAPVVQSDATPADAALLVCDDDPVSRLLLAELLRGQGYRVLEAGGAQEALEIWRGGAVRLIITDLNMPHESGLELIAALRTEEARRGAGARFAVRTPVVVCSGDWAPIEQTADAATHDAFIAKPVQLQTLLDTLAHLGIAPTPVVTPQSR